MSAATYTCKSCGAIVDVAVGAVGTRITRLCSCPEWTGITAETTAHAVGKGGVAGDLSVRQMFIDAFAELWRRFKR